MGSGQSKYYRNGSNQYPYPPPPPPLYNGQYNAPPYIPQYGPMPTYGPQMYGQQPQGFIPPGVYGQGANLPPTLLNWLPQDRRKSRRTKERERERERMRENDRFVGGFANGAPRQQEPPRRTRSESRRREPTQDPLIPPTQPSNSAPVDAGHRVSTPFNPRFRGDEDEEEEEEEEDRPRSRGTARRRSSSRQSARELYSPVHSINGEFSHVMQPLGPADPAVFGPTGPRPNTPLRNPLPPPPRDIYEMSPYKALLNMPQTSALLTASYGPHVATVVPNDLTTARPVERKKSIAKGLLRAFSKREKKESQPQPQVRFVPVFVEPKQNSNANQSQNQSHTTTQQSSAPQSVYPTPTAQQAADLIRSMSQTRPAYSQPMPHSMPPSAPMIPGPSQPVSVVQSMRAVDSSFNPIPPSAISPHTTYFSQDGPHSAFMNHSPHRVWYGGEVYPTAAHLYESMKFLGYRQDIVDKLKNCPNVLNLYEVSAPYEKAIRKDWPSIHLEKMEEVLLNKFKQHADLRVLLMSTGDGRIVYEDANDSYWGVDMTGQGENHLGKALFSVREKLRSEG
ncbi:DUF1768-domain-containing protein [Pholiota conissans]|uniref:DUF1768-domain-containing protein n=1 Tax=Pholiota conissans TaxID=109636 RepID=A0A9P6CUL7_9AGAR|nr:DUF1768-domain-containing protein [Pholiota conissans]